MGNMLRYHIWLWSVWDQILMSACQTVVASISGSIFEIGGFWLTLWLSLGFFPHSFALWVLARTWKGNTSVPQEKLFVKNFWLDLKQELSGITGKTFYKTSLLALQMQAIQRYWVLISSSGKHLRFVQFIANRERSLQTAKNSAIFSESC